LTQPPFVDFGNVGAPTSQDKDFERLNAFLREFAAHTPHVRLIDLSTLVCPSGPPCSLEVHDLDLRGDGDHYSGEGSLFVARWLMPQLGIEALHNPDTTLPVMTMVVPANGSVLKGRQAVVAIPSFNIGLAKVEFQVTGNGLLNADIGTAVYFRNLQGLRWNTTSVPNGTYTIRSVAYNVAGDTSASKGITVHVKN
jgi:hypothetical protein